MNRGAPPTRLRIKAGIGVLCVTVLGGGLWACTDQPGSTIQTDGLLALSHDRDGSGRGDDDHGHGHQSKGPRVTGSGRVDFPFGIGERNPPETRMYQTFAVHLKDSNRDGYPDRGSQVEFIDYRDQYRVNDKPMKLVSVGFTTTFQAIPQMPDCNPDLDPNCCPRGGIEVQGYFDRQNTPNYDNLKFMIRLCDVSKHGSKRSKDNDPEFTPNDKLWLQVPGLGIDPQSGQCYTIFKFPNSVQREGALLTGGNLDVDVTNTTPPGPSPWVHCQAD